LKALELYRSVPRYLATRTLVSRVPAAAALAPLHVGPLRLGDRAPHRLPGREWVRVRPRLAGICGSDLATVSGTASLYFSPLVSLPFTPGHEVVGELLDPAPAAGLPAGARVVLDPLLGCATRGLEPCAGCAGGDTGRCDGVTSGHLRPGLQTGYCADTGGGWGEELVAAPSQLHSVPDGLPDERAVLAEPAACAVHVALRAAPGPGDAVLVVGAGAVGLLTLLALRTLTAAGRVTVVAKHPRQAALAAAFGADAVVGAGEATRAVRRASRAVTLRPERGPDFLLGGVDVAVECSGTRAGLDTALRTSRAGGRVVLAGIPPAGVDLTPLWLRELELVGAYATGTETLGDGQRRSAFEVALELVADPRLGAAATAFHPLRDWRAALDTAASAGRLGLLKVGFDLGGSEGRSDDGSGT